MTEPSENGRRYNAKGAGGRTNNTLTGAQVYKLTLWVDHNRDVIRNNKWNLAEATAAAGEGMKTHGFAVTEHNLLGALRATGVELTPTKGGGARKARYREIKKVVDDLAAQVARMAEERENGKRAANERLSALEEKYQKMHALLVNQASVLKVVSDEFNLADKVNSFLPKGS